MSSYDNYSRLKEMKGVTDFAVCKATGIAPATMSDWKNGRTEPKIDKLQRIADYFNVSVEFLLTGKDSEKLSNSGKSYYFDDESAEIAQELFENKDMRVLFSAARGCDPSTLRRTYDILNILKRGNNNDNDDDNGERVHEL